MKNVAESSAAVGNANLPSKSETVAILQYAKPSLSNLLPGFSCLFSTIPLYNASNNHDDSD